MGAGSLEVLWKRVLRVAAHPPGSGAKYVTGGRETVTEESLNLRLKFASLRGFICGTVKRAKHFSVRYFAAN